MCERYSQPGAREAAIQEIVDDIVAQKHDSDTVIQRNGIKGVKKLAVLLGLAQIKEHGWGFIHTEESEGKRRHFASIARTNRAGDGLMEDPPQLMQTDAKFCARIAEIRARCQKEGISFAHGDLHGHLELDIGRNSHSCACYHPAVRQHTDSFSRIQQLLWGEAVRQAAQRKEMMDVKIVVFSMWSEFDSQKLEFKRLGGGVWPYLGKCLDISEDVSVYRARHVSKLNSRQDIDCFCDQVVTTVKEDRSCVSARQ